MNIIVAIEHRSYREILFAALQLLRPSVATTLICPDQLDQEVVRIKPQLILCSHITATIQVHAPAWIVFYPQSQKIIQIRVGNLHLTSTELDLDGLLALIDYTEYLISSQQQPMLHKG